ncbi:peptidase S8/S53 domain-containing protein [Chaetomium tenue]|uniref:Peptidase S8/S53 domain-containing protein n=1 Tax=Chaetomium tenue TaxID=1854479 RepID=A0ACB7PJT1_9PEZI|nr:peptidase S8/S53 domain-containing protein [Chaetomium globosum]
MRTQAVQAVVCSALGALLLWAPAVTAQQQQQPRIALKLTEEAQAKQQDDPNFIASLIQSASPASFRLSAPEEVSVDPILTSQRLDDLEARVVPTGKFNTFKVPNFNAWYNVQVGPGGSENQARSVGETVAQNTTGTDEPRLALPKDTLDLIHRLHKLPEVESAHALYPGPPPAVNAGDDPRNIWQGYLNAAPQGINARYAWGFPGGDGAGTNIIDVEQGWNLNHEDLAAAGITLISGRNQAWFAHGTSVLGEMFMVDNQIGGVGIIPAAKGRVVSQHREDWTYNTADAILDAAAHLSFGDIILIEAQEYDPVSGVYYWPVEIVDVNFDAIQLATAMGITVVQAGCNGGYDLDQYTSLAGKRIFDRSSPDFRDSGAIMVGGANSDVPHTRWWGSNHGSRMDVYAWSDGIDTADSDDITGTSDWYTSWFGGTSGASPIIVGAAAIVQAMSLARNNIKMHPIELRRILTTTGGTPSADPANDRIGIMPDLQAIIDTIFDGANHTSDLYLRDHVGDTGETTNPTNSNPHHFTSPDIIIRHSPLPHPSTTLGTNSGTESNPSLSDPILPGHAHSVYLRLLNRGSSPAQDTTATVYWAEPATLVTPEMWNVVGSVEVGDVAEGGVFVVAPAVEWTAPGDGAGGSGGYCFVAVVGAGTDPVPVLTGGFEEFVAGVVQGSNNVAWRNVGVVSAPPASGSGTGFHKFPVKIPGAFDEAREFVVRGVGKLPKGSKVRLQVPQGLASAMGMKGCAHRGADGQEVVVVGLQPGETVEIGKGVLAAKSAADCELQVKVPGETYKGEGDYEYALVQEWQGVEVGRITWRFGPVAEL